MTAQSPSLFHELRTLPRAFWVLCLGTFINRLGTFVYPFLTLYLNRIGLPPGHIGTVLAGYGLGSLASTLAGGWCADRFGRRVSIVAGTFAQALCVMALAFTRDTVLLALLTTLAGFSGGFYHPAASALVADLVGPARRLTAFALLRQAANAGFAFGVATGGFLINHGPFWLFAGDALTTAIFGLLALLALPPGIRKTSREARWSEALAKLRSDSGFWALFAAQLAAAFVFAQFASTYALEIARRRIHLAFAGFVLSPEQVYGLLIGWNGILIIACELPITRVTRILNARRVMAAGYGLIGAGFALNIFDHGILTLGAGITLFTVGEMLVMPMVSVWISHLAPENMRGRYMGALATAWAGGNILGPQIGLTIFAVSPAALWTACAAFGLISATMITFLGREKRPQESAPRPQLAGVPD